MRKIVAFIGPKGSGKTEIAKKMHAYGYIRVPLADPIKQMLEALLAYQGVHHRTINRMLNGDLKEMPSKFLGNRSPRHAMQTLGTEWRDTISKILWADIWKNSISNKLSNIVIDDMRFLHEVPTVRELGGTIVKITRPGIKPTDLHPSEQEFLQISFDLHIVNDTTPMEAAQQIIHFLERQR